MVQAVAHRFFQFAALFRVECFQPRIILLQKGQFLVLAVFLAIFGFIGGTSVWEVKECKRACMSVMKELEAEGIPYNKDTELGIWARSVWVATMNACFPFVKRSASS